MGSGRFRRVPEGSGEFCEKNTKSFRSVALAVGDLALLFFLLFQGVLLIPGANSEIMVALILCPCDDSFRRIVWGCLSGYFACSLVAVPKVLTRLLRVVVTKSPYLANLSMGFPPYSFRHLIC